MDDEAGDGVVDGSRTKGGIALGGWVRWLWVGGRRA